MSDTPEWAEPQHRWTITVCSNHPSDIIRNVLCDAVDYIGESFGFDHHTAFDVAAFGPDVTGGGLIASRVHIHDERHCSESLTGWHEFVVDTCCHCGTKQGGTE